MPTTYIKRLHCMDKARQLEKINHGFLNTENDPNRENDIDTAHHKSFKLKSKS